MQINFTHTAINHKKIPYQHSSYKCFASRKKLIHPSILSATATHAYNPHACIKIFYSEWNIVRDMKWQQVEAVPCGIRKIKINIRERYLVGDYWLPWLCAHICRLYAKNFSSSLLPLLFFREEIKHFSRFFWEHSNYFIEKLRIDLMDISILISLDDPMRKNTRSLSYLWRLSTDNILMI